jgi:RNA polymerase sigma factor (TIGR02999 family)
VDEDARERDSVDKLVAELGTEGCRNADRLVPALYGELRALAGKLLQEERRGHTLEPTALVHEAYLRLAGAKDLGCESREQFLAWAARVMRQVLVSHARARKRQKRGGGAQRVPLDEVLVRFEESASDLESLDEALDDLARLDPRKSRMVELRFFGGLTNEEVATVLGISRATVERDWRFVRAWLRARLGGGEGSGAGACE